MLKVTRWCIAHRRRVFIAWVAVAFLTTILAGAAGRNYATNFSLPGTESQRALDLLKKEFPAQSGDVDTIVFHTANGTVDDPAVKAAMTKLLAQVRSVPHVVAVRSPYDPGGAVQVSHDRSTAFATINWSKPANQLPNAAGKPVLDQINAVNVPGLKIAAGGQVIEQAEGFSVGPATLIGAIAALVILLFTFGSLIAAGMPLITAGFGLITGVALIGLATHVTSIPNVSTDLALMIGLGVGVDYALFIVTRFRENYLLFGDVERSVIEAMDTSGRAILLAGTTVVIALLGMFATGVSFMYGLSIASILAVLLTLLASLTVLPAMLSRWGHRIVRTRSARRGLFRRGGPAPSGEGVEVGADAVAVLAEAVAEQLGAGGRSEAPGVPDRFELPDGSAHGGDCGQQDAAGTQDAVHLFDDGRAGSEKVVAQAHRSSFPGFSIPWGSKAFFSARSCRMPSPCSRGRKTCLARPMPW